jgi:hypothetical protein
VSKQRTSGRLERRAEREARENRGGSAPRSRRQRPVAKKVDSGGPSFLPGPLRNMSGQALGISIIVVLMGAFLIYGVVALSASSDSTPDWVTAQMDDDPDLPGEYIPPHPGADGKLNTSDDRNHFGTGTVVPICTQEQIDSGNVSNPLCYTSNPPTSGPHADQPMPFGVLKNPAPKENLLHNMEHGGIVIWYNTTNQDVIDQINKLTQDNWDRRRFVVSSAYSGMEPETIAVTAWTRMDKFPVSDFNTKRISDFISEHQKRFNPEGF